MCNPSVEQNPERRLSEIMARELDVSIDPIALRLFLRSNWTIVSGLAHRIHDGTQRRADLPKAGERL